MNRLQSAEEKVNTSTTWKQTFTYDRYGNRRFDAANTTTLAASNNITNPTIDTATNRFSSGQNYTYDKDGNLTGDASGNQFLYDAENHQKEVKNSSNQTVGLYVYDGEGKRVKKISSTETVIFVYDGGGQLVAEYSTQLAQTPQVSYLTTDHLGSPRVITNQLGAVTTRKDYMAFGEETYTTQRTSSLNYDNQSETRKGYTGYEKDDESGLDFAQARYYNSKHGRFTSVDPLTASANVKNPQTFNRYSYVLNSPYKFTDPLGLISSSTGACGTDCRNSGDFVDGSAFRGTDSSFEWANGDTYYTATRTTQYQTTAQDVDKKADITITVTESLVVDRNGNVVVGDNNPSVTATAKSVGSNPISDSQLRSIENIAATGVRVAMANNFSVGVMLAILKTETQFGIQPNREPGKPANKISEINPGQFSATSGLGRAVSEAEAGGAQRA